MSSDISKILDKLKPVLPTGLDPNVQVKPDKKPLLDFNKDGKVNILDFYKINNVRSG